jgi:hypothetical protein
MSPIYSGGKYTISVVFVKKNFYIKSTDIEINRSLLIFLYIIELLPPFNKKFETHW